MNANRCRIYFTDANGQACTYDFPVKGASDSRIAESVARKAKRGTIDNVECYATKSGACREIDAEFYS